MSTTYRENDTVGAHDPAAVVPPFTMLSTYKYLECEDGGAAGTSVHGVSDTAPITSAIGISWESKAGQPGLEDWVAGDWKVRLNVTSANASFYWNRWDAYRVDVDGNILALVATSEPAIPPPPPFVQFFFQLNTTGTKTWASTRSFASSGDVTDTFIVVLDLEIKGTGSQLLRFKSDKNILTPWDIPTPEEEEEDALIRSDARARGASGGVILARGA